MFVLFQQDPEPATDAGWYTERLANGVRINVLTIDAPVAAVFTFLPIGLADDPPGRAQFAHLAEHMLIRSADPESLQVGELRLNGETTNQVLRLECIGPATQWREALARHPRWLCARSFDTAVIEREKLRIAGEERATVANGFNHKWASAAWSQIVEGREHAAVHGDVANATAQQLEHYVATRVKLSDAQVFVASPQPSSEVVAALRDDFAKLGPAANPEPPAATPGVAAGEPGHRSVTWDIDAQHYLEWYELPQGTSAAAAEILAQVLTAACFQTGALSEIPGRALVGAVNHGGVRCVLFSCNQPKGTGIDDLQAAFRSAIERAPTLARFQVRGEMFARRYGVTPDFEAERKRVADPRMRDLIEANFAMQCGYSCARLGETITDVPAAYRALDREQIGALAKQCCRSESRYSASISPSAEDESK